MKPDILTSKILIKRLLSEHIKPYKRRLMMACLCMLVAALSTTALAYLLQPVFDEVFTKKDPWILVIFCGSILTVFIAKGASSYGETVLMTYVGQRIISDIQNRLFKHLMWADLAFFHRNNSGELLSRFTNDVNLMRNAVASTLIGIGKDTLTLVGLIGLMFYRDFTLACLAFFLFPAAILPIAKIGRKMRKVTYNTQEVVAQFTTQLSQTLQNIRVVKAYGAENFESSRAHRLIERIFGLIYKSTRIRSASHPIMEALSGVAIVSIIAYGGWQIMNGDRTTGDFVSFIAALLLSYEPLKRLSNMNTNLQEGLAAAGRVFQLLDEAPSIQEENNPTELSSCTGEITFDHVSFAYNKGHNVLKDISLTVKAGQTIAFVGPSGAGKSTIINLIPRFYDVTEGAILVDGHDIRSIGFNNLRSHIALVSQEIALFDMTVYENIAYGQDHATEESVINAAKDAAAHDFICKLPQGYQTSVGENGVILSGGQRQRIAIARAMLKNAPILLLDEATSALDTESERQVQGALKTLMQNRTTIMVAHRLSTVIDADCIYVLDHGRIIESGSHKKLLSSDSLYAKLWAAQSQSAA